MENAIENKEVTVKLEPSVQLDVDLGEKDFGKVEAPKEEPKKDELDIDTAKQAVSVLSQQLEAKKREALEAQRAKAAAEAFAYEQAKKTQSLALEAQDNQLTAFVNAIASFERDAEMLEREYASRLEQGDYNSAAKVQRQMSQVESRLSQLAHGKEALESRLQYEREYAKQDPYAGQQQYQQPQYQQMPQDPVEAAIAGLSPASQQWARQNVELLRDDAKRDQVVRAHYSALGEGIVQDSPEYFAFVESKVKGGGQKNPSKGPITSAPVSRGGSATYQGNGNVSVRLTPEQRMYARDVLGISDEEYAEGLVHYAGQGKMTI